MPRKPRMYLVGEQCSRSKPRSVIRALRKPQKFAKALSFHPPTGSVIKVIPIFVIKENVLPVVSAQHYMIESTGYVKSCFSGHGRQTGLTSLLMQLRSPDPFPDIILARLAETFWDFRAP